MRLLSSLVYVFARSGELGVFVHFPISHSRTLSFPFYRSVLTVSHARAHSVADAALRLHVLPESVDIHNWKQAPGNINLEHWASSTPVDAHPFKHGFYDVIGAHVN